MAQAERVCTNTRGTPQEGIPANLSPAARLLLMLLQEYCGFGSARKEFCWPSQRTLSERMGCSRRYVGKLLLRLIQSGYVSSEARFRRDGSRTSNRYWLLEKPASPPGAGGPNQQGNPLRETNPNRETENPAATQSVQRAVNSRSPNQLSSTPPKPVGQPIRTHGPSVETSVKQQGRKQHGPTANVSLKQEETGRAGGTREATGWNGGGIKPERFESKQEATERYSEALQRGWVDSSEATRLAFFSTWAGIVRLYRAGDVINPGGYLSALLKRRLITRFPTLDDEATVQRCGLLR
jgi:GntR family transcriptional regulator